MAANPELITDPHNDIAMNENLVEMRINIPQRQTFQKIFVEVGEGGRLTTTGYKADQDAPSGWIPRLTPSKEELAPGSSTKEMLVVGLCLLDQPRQYSAYGTGPKSKAKQEEKAKQGVITRPDRVSRVVVELTKYISPNNLNFYVTIDPSFGVYHVKRTTKDTVFFFHEFWPGMVKQLKTKPRGLAFSDVCKEAAAEIKDYERNTILQVNSSSNTEWLATKELKISTLQNLSAHLALQYNTLRQTRNPSIARAMAESLVDHLPQTENNPESSSDSIDAFYDESRDFSIRDCETMLEEFNSRHEDLPPCEPIIIKRIRDSLERLGKLNQIPRDDFVFFLMMAHDGLSAEDNEIVVDKHVSYGVKIVQYKQKYQTGRATKTVTTVGENDQRLVVAAVLESMEQLSECLLACAANIKGADGRFQDFTSIEELMARIGNVQLAAANLQDVERVERMMKVSRTYMGVEGVRAL